MHHPRKMEVHHLCFIYIQEHKSFSLTGHTLRLWVCTGYLGAFASLSWTDLSFVGNLDCFWVIHNFFLLLITYQAKNEPGSISSKTGTAAPKKPDDKSTSDKTSTDKKDGGKFSWQHFYLVGWKWHFPRSHAYENLQSHLLCSVLVSFLYPTWI